jgi:hypothetical protein
MSSHRAARETLTYIEKLGVTTTAIDERHIANIMQTLVYDGVAETVFDASRAAQVYKVPAAPFRKISGPLVVYLLSPLNTTSSIFHLPSSIEQAQACFYHLNIRSFLFNRLQLSRTPAISPEILCAPCGVCPVFPIVLSNLTTGVSELCRGIHRIALHLHLSEAMDGGVIQHMHMHDTVPLSQPCPIAILPYCHHNMVRFQCSFFLVCPNGAFFCFTFWSLRSGGTHCLDSNIVSSNFGVIFQVTE